jgi:hypothetical protein
MRLGAPQMRPAGGGRLSISYTWLTGRYDVHGYIPARPGLRVSALCAHVWTEGDPHPPVCVWVWAKPLRAVVTDRNRKLRRLCDAAGEARGHTHTQAHPPRPPPHTHTHIYVHTRTHTHAPDRRVCVRVCLCVPPASEGCHTAKRPQLQLTCVCVCVPQ